MSDNLTILNILACYNSLDIMPYVLEYNQREGVDSFVIDNYSDDGSWEYLQDNKIPSKRLDTGGAFYTTKIQAAKLVVVRVLQPDWVIRGSSDHFILTPDPMRTTIERIDKDGYNAISMPISRVWNTGETTQGDPRKIYFHYSIANNIVSIHKAKGFNSYDCEQIKMTDMKLKALARALLLDYGNTRGKEKREDEYHRRQIAWERGEPRGHGIHYASGSKRGWKWDKDHLLDIRESEYWPVFCARFGDI